jgi:histidine triad (HIT) family protein
LHLLFVTKRHFEDARGLKDAALLGRLCRAAVETGGKSPEAEGGFRLVMNTGAGAGQSVFHIHLHFLAGRPFAWPPG